MFAKKSCTNLTLKAKQFRMIYAEYFTVKISIYVLLFGIPLTAYGDFEDWLHLPFMCPLQLWQPKAD